VIGGRRGRQPFLNALATARISLSPTHIGHQATSNATLQPRGPLVVYNFPSEAPSPWVILHCREPLKKPPDTIFFLLSVTLLLGLGVYYQSALKVYAPKFNIRETVTSSNNVYLDHVRGFTCLKYK